MQKNNFKNKKSGFTIIEMMVAIAVFLVVVTAGIGALLNAYSIHGKSQAVRSMMDNLNFIMDDMSKNIKTGYDYHCIDDVNVDENHLSTPHNCKSGNGIAFKSSIDGKIWVYVVSDGKIQKRVAKGDFVELNSSGVTIENLDGFSVIGSESFTDGQQPFTEIRLVGKIIYKNENIPFSLENSVSQRRIDVAI